VQIQGADPLIGIKIGEMGMKIYKKEMMFDSDPSLHMAQLESGKFLIYAGKPDETINSIWKRSVLQ